MAVHGEIKVATERVYVWVAQAQEPINLAGTNTYSVLVTDKSGKTTGGSIRHHHGAGELALTAKVMEFAIGEGL